jgi:hypothetical protein
MSQPGGCVELCLCLLLASKVPVRLAKEEVQV